MNLITVEQGHGCELVARLRSMEDEFSRTKDAFPGARLALLILVIHCVKPPSCGVPPGVCGRTRIVIFECEI
jgi:hypothetical protein